VRPKRVCALCPATIRDKLRLCSNCTETWKDNLTDPWMYAIIKESEYQHNVDLRDYKRVVSIERIHNI
jgi:predicted amidophosphoribosyltransferase